MKEERLTREINRFWKYIVGTSWNSLRSSRPGLHREGNEKQDEQGDDPIEEEEVEITISKLKIGKIASQDQVAPEFIKYGGNELVKVVQISFQIYGVKKGFQKIGNST